MSNLEQRIELVEGGMKRANECQGTHKSAVDENKT